MRKHWVLVANGSLASLFCRTSVDDPLTAVETIDFPEGGFKGREFERDHLGHGSTGNSSPGAHFRTHPSLGKKGVHPFAQELAQRLEEGVVDGEYETFSLIASNPLLSDIKVCLNRGVAYRLKWAHEADLTGLDAETLERRLRELRVQSERGMPAH
jgi:protein required for attachment to host cells